MRRSFAIAALLFSVTALAYEVDTHAVIARFAVDASELTQDSQLLPRLGLRALPPSDPGQKFPNEDSYYGIWWPASNQSIRDLVSHGAQYEDTRSASQAPRHFYNPVNGQPLVFAVPPTVSAFADAAQPSPTWSLEDTQDFGGMQPYSYRKGRRYLFEALTAPEKDARTAAWGKLFQTLGHVVHHIQDMAQPQHVRNDIHCDIRGLCNLFAPGTYSPSQFEKWTRKYPPMPDVFQSYSYGPVYSPGKTSIFVTPRRFWTTTNVDGSGPNGTGGYGIAEYTNRGFYSTGTGPTDLSSCANPNFPSPSACGVTFYTMSEVCQGATPECPAEVAQSNYYIGFYANDVVDSLTGVTDRNRRAISRSVYDQDLKDSGRPYVFAVNRFNVEASTPLLLPRAVAYSAGLINYFFRGKIKVALPSEGVYGAIDSVLPAGADPQTSGFAKIKAKVQNVTPGGEAVATGLGAGDAPPYLIAVAKFHRNRCYTNDLAHEYGVVDENGNHPIRWNGSPQNADGTWSTTSGCRMPEEIVASKKAAVPPGINTELSDVTFDFSEQQIPLSATDLFLQVIYRGPLGQETDGIAIETKGISEPTYVYSLPRAMDHVRHAAFPSVAAGPYSWEQWCAQGGMTVAQCDDDYGLRRKWRFSPLGPYDPAVSPSTAGNNYPVADEPTFAPLLVAPAYIARYGRAAVLADLEQSPDPNFLAIDLFETGISEPETYQWNWIRTPPVTVQLDPLTNTLTPSHEYKLVRGAYLYSGTAQVYDGGDDVTVRPLQPVATTVAFPN